MFLAKKNPKKRPHHFIFENPIVPFRPLHTPTSSRKRFSLSTKADTPMPYFSTWRRHLVNSGMRYSSETFFNLAAEGVSSKSLIPTFLTDLPVQELVPPFHAFSPLKKKSRNVRFSLANKFHKLMISKFIPSTSLREQIAPSSKLTADDFCNGADQIVLIGSKWTKKLKFLFKVLHLVMHK